MRERTISVLNYRELNLFTSMVSGANARFLRGCRMGFCPHSKTAEVWTAISISAPLWLKLWGSTARRDGSLFVTRQAAKFCMSGEFRTPEFWMNSVIVLICWKHTFKEIKPAWYHPSNWGELAAASDAMLSSALKTFSICPGQGIIRTKSSFTNDLNLTYPYQWSMFITSPENQASYLLFGMKIWVINSIQDSDLSENSKEQMDSLYSWGAAGCLKRRTDDTVEKRWQLSQMNSYKVSVCYWSALSVLAADFSRSALKMSPHMKGNDAEITVQATCKWVIWQPSSWLCVLHQKFLNYFTYSTCICLPSNQASTQVKKKSQCIRGTEKFKQAFFVKLLPEHFHTQNTYWKKVSCTEITWLILYSKTQG